jgi:ABC-type multidrug transport system fused ATPase/permease subunit
LGVALVTSILIATTGHVQTQHMVQVQPMKMATAEALWNKEMIRAAQQAHIHEFILSLPRGYDTEVGEQGIRLSGGERQRLAIARALLKNAPVLLLDEPTANLDAVTAQDIRQMLRVLICQRTTLLITHEFADIEMVDEVVVLQQSEYGCMSALKSLSEMGGEIANEAISAAKPPLD